MAPTVAVVIPLYNGARYIHATMWSVRRQTRPPNEIIVVDDASDDLGPAIVQAVAGVRLIHQDRAGPSAARNTGVHYSSSNLIAFLDHDDLWYPNHLEMLLKPFAQDAALGWSYSDLDLIDKDGLYLASHHLAQGPARHPKTSIEECLRFDMLVVPSASIVSRQAFDAVDGFDPLLTGMEDDDLFLRLYAAGYRNVFVPEPTVQWRHHLGGASHSEQMRVSRIRYLRKLVRMFPDDPDGEKQHASRLIAPRFVSRLMQEYRLALDTHNDARIGLAYQDITEAVENMTATRRAAYKALLMPLRYQKLARLAFAFHRSR